MSTIDHVKRPDADNPLFSARTTLPLPASASISFHDPERRQWGDVVLTPTLAVPPFPLHIQGVEKIDGHIVQPFQWLAFTFPLNMTGHHLDDALVLRASAAFEQARPWADKWPALLAEKGL